MIRKRVKKEVDKEMVKEVERYIEDLEMIGLIKREGNRIAIDADRTLAYFVEAFWRFKEYLRMQGKLEEFKRLLREDDEEALRVAVGSVVIGTVAYVRMLRGMKSEEARSFTAEYIAKITSIYLALLRKTPAYAMLLGALHGTFLD